MIFSAYADLFLLTIFGAVGSDLIQRYCGDPKNWLWSGIRTFDWTTWFRFQLVLDTGQIAFNVQQTASLANRMADFGRQYFCKFKITALYHVVQLIFVSLLPSTELSPHDNSIRGSFPEGLFLG